MGEERSPCVRAPRGSDRSRRPAGVEAREGKALGGMGRGGRVVWEEVGWGGCRAAAAPSPRGTVPPRCCACAAAAAAAFALPRGSCFDSHFVPRVSGWLTIHGRENHAGAHGEKRRD